MAYIRTIMKTKNNVLNQTKITEYSVNNIKKIQTPFFFNLPERYQKILYNVNLLWRYISEEYEPKNECFETFIEKAEEKEISPILALYQAISNYRPESVEIDIPQPKDAFDQYLDEAIDDWLCNTYNKEIYPQWKMKHDIIVIETLEGEIHPVFVEEIYPNCDNCGCEMSLDSNGEYYCSYCDYIED